VTSEDAVLEYDPRMPGQTSPFKIMIRDNPLIKTFRVNFKHIFGSTIPFKDSTSRSLRQKTDPGDNKALQANEDVAIYFNFKRQTSPLRFIIQISLSSPSCE